jgi:hypothetical protein
VQSMLKLRENKWERIWHKFPRSVPKWIWPAG